MVGVTISLIGCGKKWRLHPINPDEAPAHTLRMKGIDRESKTVATDITLQGDYAYLCVGPRLVVVNVSDPRHPVVEGRRSGCL